MGQGLWLLSGQWADKGAMLPTDQGKGKFSGEQGKQQKLCLRLHLFRNISEAHSLEQAG